MSAARVGLQREDAQRLVQGEHGDPHAVLGAHPASHEAGGRRSEGLVVRAFHPDAVAAECLPAGGHALPMEALAAGLLAALVADALVESGLVRLPG